MAGDELLRTLEDAFESVQHGAQTRPVSVTLPTPLADAFRALADAGVVDSVSEATTRALLDTLQSQIIGLRLDALYAEEPDARPDEEAIAALAARAGVQLP